MASPLIEDRDCAARIPLKLNDIHDHVLYAMESSKLKDQKSCLDGGVKEYRGADLREAAAVEN